MNAGGYYGGSGGNSGGLGGGHSGEPPNLAQFSDVPKYDLATVARFLGVRRMALWNWEQQLGISSRTRGVDDGSSVPSYSERDLQALVWLRDQILEGVPLHEAVDRLFGKPSAGDARPREGAEMTPGMGVRINTRPLSPTFGPRLQGATQPPNSDHLSMAMPAMPAIPGVFPRGSQAAPPTPRFGVATRTYPPTELQALVPRLVQAFAALDTAAANRVVEEARAARSVELVCKGLLLPALARVGELWAHQENTIPEGRFATNYIRGFLFFHFHRTPERPELPVVMVGCALKEYAEVGALTLAVFLRNTGLRVIYLGQDAGDASLLEQVRAHRPALLVLTITSTKRVRSLAHTAKEVAQLPMPRPVFTYSGPVFARNPDVGTSINGVCLGDDPVDATWRVRRLLGIELSS